MDDASTPAEGHSIDPAHEAYFGASDDALNAMLDPETRAAAWEAEKRDPAARIGGPGDSTDRHGNAIEPVWEIETGRLRLMTGTQLLDYADAYPDYRSYRDNVGHVRFRPVAEELPLPPAS